MPLGEPRGRLKCSKKTIGIAAFVRTETMRKPSNVRCVMLGKVIQSLICDRICSIVWQVNVNDLKTYIHGHVDSNIYISG